MAGWPTLTLLMSDSLKATVIVSVLVLTISAKPGCSSSTSRSSRELLDPPRLPARADGAASRPSRSREPELELELDDGAVPPAEIASPGETSASETTVRRPGA